jgi:hypothetical protein
VGLLSGLEMAANAEEATVQDLLNLDGRSCGGYLYQRLSERFLAAIDSVQCVRSWD